MTKEQSMSSEPSNIQPTAGRGLAAAAAAISALVRPESGAIWAAPGQRAVAGSATREHVESLATPTARRLRKDPKRRPRRSA